jgi:multiple sugar transport system permease protein
MMKSIKKMAGYLGKYGILIIASMVVVFPVYWMVLTALTTNGAMLSNTSILPNTANLTMDNINKVMQGEIWRWFLNSFFVTVLSALLGIMVSLLAAYGMSRFRSKLNDAFGFFLLVVRMLPASLLVVPLYIIFANAQLINNHMSLIFVNISSIVPFAAWMMKGFFDSIPYSLEEAAQIDGCNIYQAAVRVVLPLTSSGLAATGIYAVIVGWGEYLFARTLTANPRKWTLTVGVSNFIGEHGVQWGEIMSAATLSIIPVVVVYFVMNRYLISGMTQGAVKE